MFLIYYIYTTKDSVIDITSYNLSALYKNKVFNLVEKLLLYNYTIMFKLEYSAIINYLYRL